MLDATISARFTARVMRRLLGVLLFGFLAAAVQTSSVTASDGLHKQPWFHESFLDLKEDLADAQSAGKGLIVAFEQAGCPYCREMHRVNLADPEIVTFLKKHFLFVQLDLRGSREVTDFDGKSMEERALARRWGIVFTPTLLIFSSKTKAKNSKAGRMQSSAVMPGYFKPFHFRTMLEYVSGGHHANKHFQDYVNERARQLRADGKKVKIW